MNKLIKFPTHSAITFAIACLFFVVLLHPIAVNAQNIKPVCRCQVGTGLPTIGEWKIQCFDTGENKWVDANGQKLKDGKTTCLSSSDLCQRSGASGSCNPITDAVISGPFQIPTVGGLMTSLIRLFFFIAGLLSLLYILLGAFEWVRSGGKEEDIEGAQKKIMAAIIGLIVMVSVLTLVIIIEQVIFSGTVCLGISCPLKLDDIRLVTPN